MTKQTKPDQTDRCPGSHDTSSARALSHWKHLGGHGAGSGGDPASRTLWAALGGPPGLDTWGAQGAPAALKGTPDPSSRAPDSAPRLLPPRMAAQGHWSDPGPLQRPGARGPGTRGPGVWVRGCGMVCEAVRLLLKGWHSALLGDKAEKSQQAKCERFPNTTDVDKS